MTKQKITIILLNWNGGADTMVCLASLQNLEARGLAIQIMVVDNHSTDGLVAQVRKKYPGVQLIELKENLGFTGGNNIGIKKALEDGAEFVWVLNNDTIVDPKSLHALVAAFDDPTVGIAGSKIYFMKGREFHHDRYKSAERGKVIWYAGGVIDWDNILPSHRGVDKVDHGQYNREEETDFVTGCSLMISRQCIETIGVFDEQYFAYLEDLDLSTRAKHVGFRVVYIPTSVVWHKNAGSTARPGNEFQQYYMTRNRLMFGVHYASIKTKFALVREAFRYAMNGTTAQKKAVIDAALGRFQKQYEWKKKL